MRVYSVFICYVWVLFSKYLFLAVVQLVVGVGACSSGCMRVFLSSRLMLFMVEVLLFTHPLL